MARLTFNSVIVILLALLGSRDLAFAQEDFNQELERLMQSQKNTQQQLLQLQQRMIQSMGQAGSGAVPPAAKDEVIDFNVPDVTERIPVMPGIAGRAMMGAPSGRPAPSSMPATLDAASAKAAAETNGLLNSPDAIEAFVKRSGGAAAAADALVDHLTSDPRVKQAIYGLSSDVFNELVRRTNGDPSRMLEEMEKAKKDPESFAKTWSPETREKLRSLSGKVEAPPTDSK